MYWPLTWITHWSRMVTIRPTWPHLLVQRCSWYDVFWPFSFFFPVCSHPVSSTVAVVSSCVLLSGVFTFSNSFVLSLEMYVHKRTFSLFFLICVFGYSFFLLVFQLLLLWLLCNFYLSTFFFMLIFWRGYQFFCIIRHLYLLVLVDLPLCVESHSHCLFL